MSPRFRLCSRLDSFSAVSLFGYSLSFFVCVCYFVCLFVVVVVVFCVCAGDGFCGT